MVCFFNTLQHYNRLLIHLGGSHTYDFGTVGSVFTWNGQQNNPIIVQAFPGDKITILGKSFLILTSDSF
jgi:hypothetical protein